MLVAGNQTAYGKASKSVFVRQPINLIATAPRRVAPNETFKLPVAVFVDDKLFDEKNKSVSVSVKLDADEHFNKVAKDSFELTFTQAGDQLGFIPVKVASKLGIGRVVVEVVSGEHKAEQVIHLPVVSPNPHISSLVKKVIDKGDTWQFTQQPFGLEGTNKIAVGTFSRTAFESRIKTRQFNSVSPWLCRANNFRSVSSALSARLS